MALSQTPNPPRFTPAMPGKKKLSKQRLPGSDLDWTALVAIVALKKRYMAASCANEKYCTAVESSDSPRDRMIDEEIRRA
jgi:hypothetical protein